MKRKKSIRGTINALKIKQTAKFLKEEHKLSTVRTTAHSVGADTDKKFTVTSIDGIIIVKRTA